MELAICHDINVQPETVMRQSGIQHQRDLIAAMRAGDAPAVHTILAQHMQEAEQRMLGLQARIERISLEDRPELGRKRR